MFVVYEHMTTGFDLWDFMGDRQLFPVVKITRIVSVNELETSTRRKVFSWCFWQPRKDVHLAPRVYIHTKPLFSCWGHGKRSTLVLFVSVVWCCDHRLLADELARDTRKCARTVTALLQHPEVGLMHSAVKRFEQRYRNSNYEAFLTGMSHVVLVFLLRHNTDSVNVHFGYSFKIFSQQPDVYWQ